jgi:hypothetical protein
MKSWAILGFDKHTICSRHSISDEGCNYKFNNLILGVWCVTCSQLLEGPNCESQTEDNGKARSWGTLPGSAL